MQLSIVDVFDIVCFSLTSSRTGKYSQNDLILFFLSIDLLKCLILESIFSSIVVAVYICLFHIGLMVTRRPVLFSIFHHPLSSVVWRRQFSFSLPHIPVQSAIFSDRKETEEILLILMYSSIYKYIY